MASAPLSSELTEQDTPFSFALHAAECLRVQLLPLRAFIDHGFRIDEATGTLTAVPGSPFVAGLDASNVATAR